MTKTNTIEKIKFPEALDRLKKKLASVSQYDQPINVTLIFGAGATLALAPDIWRAKASWSGLLTALMKHLSDEHAKSVSTLGTDGWAKTTSFSHRAHIINALAAGDPDMCVATTFLLQRLQEQFFPEGHYWQRKLNDMSCELEAACLANISSKWKEFYQTLGMLAKAGKVFPVTTNFDHLIARVSELGCYIPQLGNCEDLFLTKDETNKNEMLMPEEVKRLKESSLPGTKAVSRLWSMDAAFPSKWYEDTASVMHIHGSRRIGESLVFDPSSYQKLTDIAKEPPLRSFFRGRGARSGIVVMIGCGATLWDPHFSEYWKDAPTSESVVMNLMENGSAEESARQLSLPDSFINLPTIVQYGGYEDLPEKLIALLAVLK